jgi:hypothetical protein
MTSEQSLNHTNQKELGFFVLQCYDTGTGTRRLLLEKSLTLFLQPKKREKVLAWTFYCKQHNSSIGGFIDVAVKWGREPPLISICH